MEIDRLFIIPDYSRTTGNQSGAIVAPTAKEEKMSLD
jgi:hypothetical protein